MKTINIGTEVKRIAHDSRNGKLGKVIEINGDRARVAWDNSPRTWVNFRFLDVVASTEAVTCGEWIETPNVQSYSAFRVCTNAVTGETWHEYKGKRRNVRGKWVPVND